MSSALNCNRCGAFVSLAPNPEKLHEQPAPGWKRLEVNSIENFDRASFEAYPNRTHLCPKCIAAHNDFMANKDVAASPFVSQCRISVDLHDLRRKPAR